ncbi:hypothetical protein [uncultured Kordia sp.]|uniref:hypothetical protein n=1 Tax=uncultured Kordia sp. TaxID=507699 RepID=UPI002616862E|nr:hypothetical protein [uncultured Kordia sp.]
MNNNELHNKETGFNTPKDYFNTFEERLFDRMKTEAVIPKETGFTTPDAYFDSLEDSLSKKLFSTEETPKVIPLQRKRNYLKHLSYAAAACILFFVAINLINTDSDANLTIDKVVNSEINEFIENDLIALNNYDLIAVYEEENVDITTTFEVNLDEIDTIDYLENTTDPYDLLTEQQ